MNSITSQFMQQYQDEAAPPADFGHYQGQVQTSMTGFGDPAAPSINDAMLTN
jgi:hypothetical protein